MKKKINDLEFYFLANLKANSCAYRYRTRIFKSQYSYIFVIHILNRCKTGVFLFETQISVFFMCNFPSHLFPKEK